MIYSSLNTGNLRVTACKLLYYTVLCVCVCVCVLQLFWFIVQCAYGKLGRIHIKLLTTVTPGNKGRIKRREGKREILIFFLNQLLYCLKIFTIKML